MDELWQTIIGGLAVAAITGLSVIAYRHPTAYSRIYRPVARVLIGAWVIWFIYEIGFSSGFTNAVIATIKLNSGTMIKTPDHGFTSFWPFMAPGILYVYLSFLTLLPHLLRDEASKSEKAKDDA